MGFVSRSPAALFLDKRLQVLGNPFHPGVAAGSGRRNLLEAVLPGCQGVQFALDPHRAHFLPRLDGIHGRPAIGIAMDFKVLKKELDAVLGELDHKNLNEHPHFKDTNATSENLAMYIYQRLKPAVNLPGVRLSRVRVCESPSSGASYFE